MMKQILLFFALPYLTLQSNVTEDSCPVGPWGQLLEEWATDPGPGSRQGRILSLPQTNGYYVTDRIDRPSLPPPRQPYHEGHEKPYPRPPYNEWPDMTPPPPPGKIVNRPPNPYKDKVKPGYNPNKPSPQSRPPQRPGSVDRVDDPPRKEVSETDLYLLGAIEKLVYRVDLMEKRLRKMEESVHYLVAGGSHNGVEKLPAPEPCSPSFTRIGGVCYHFSRAPLDWKSSNLACRKMSAHLLELDAEAERRQMVAVIQADTSLRGADWWTGGLNPGLLWIWSNSARPVLPNATATTNSTTTTPVTHIYGEGRCLGLTYDPSVRVYVYRGQDCSLAHRYVCEKTEDSMRLSNEIERVARTMRLAHRHPKLDWTDVEQDIL